MQKDNITKHKEYQKLARCVYKEHKNKCPKDWIELNHFENRNSGFYATAFTKNNEIVIAIRGTDDNKDRKNADANLLFGQIPNQFYDAKKFYEKIKKNNPNTKITFVGHSLGGSLSQLMSNATGYDAVTFNAYGVRNIIGHENDNHTNIINYGNAYDATFTLNFKNHLGKTLIIGNPESKKLGITIPNSKKVKKYHSLETMGDIEKAEDYEKLYGKITRNEDRGEPDLDINRIFTTKEIEKMNVKEFSRKSKHIHRQYKEFGIPTEKQAQEEVKSGNLIWVDDYKRDDGTPVQGYYRRRVKI